MEENVIKERKSLKKISLDGTWQMRGVDQERWIEAQVPGSMYQALLEAGEMEDPFYRDNEREAFFLSGKDYLFRRSFMVDREFLKEQKIFLLCHGIDTFADIYINGSRVLSCSNMHRTWEAEIKEFLKEGENEICVSFTSPFTAEEQLKAKYPDIDLEGHLFQSRIQLRKAAFMYEWDWGPTLPDMGIWKSIELCGYAAGRIQSLTVKQEHSFEAVRLECHVESDLWMPGIRQRITVYSPEGELLEQKEAVDGTAEFVIDHPKLWWCVGYGEQPLYRVDAELLYGISRQSKEQVIDSVSKKIGLRTLTVVQEQDLWGRSFYFKINGVEVFARGADYIPEDSLLGRVTKEKTEKLLDSCLKANFNTIRVWGGGVYPSDDFLDYCDEHGLMVWQDFMFANIVSLWMGEEKENMESEIREQLRRLRDHACIALLCGNNETEMMIWKDMEPRLQQMYVKQYEEDMPRIVQEEAPNLFYWPSSPSSFGGMKDTENENYGDSHDWNVWHGEKPFTYYRTTFPRFNSEFGLQSFPCMKTIQSFTLPEDRNIFSFVMEDHQKSKNGNRVINSYISQYFKFPKDFEALVYLSQMIQMEGIRYGVEHWRRNRNDRRCMGTLFWQVNDCWPVASWASIDSFGRWKGLQYGARRFFSPVLVSACEEDSIVDLFVTNETLKRTEGELCWKLFHVEKGLIREEKVSCNVKRLHSERIAHVNLENELRTPADRRKCYLAYSYESNGQIVGEGTVLFVPAKHFEFRRPHITCTRVSSNSWKLISDEYAKFVEVGFEKDVILSDNYFDLIPGKEKIVTAEQEVREEPRIYSLYDSILA